MNKYSVIKKFIRLIVGVCEMLLFVNILFNILALVGLPWYFNFILFLIFGFSCVVFWKLVLRDYMIFLLDGVVFPEEIEKTKVVSILKPDVRIVESNSERNTTEKK